ncbi:hypothetical protein, conserved [Eimeria tenella]|uniref:Transmembrane protein n=1 Tax=Eimeria tenella TaxID=5802 RepID=U6KJF9_EIMTE|nr:hypothetical protein, conserved [Eimeria tenella]CDJ36926.1 hypothetical protein, conserved [Eimeria tenella]|eukprot:XP_013227764.1 hypothetical protein, conserved [Eimeria tenella]
MKTTKASTSRSAVVASSIHNSFSQNGTRLSSARDRLVTPGLFCLLCFLVLAATTPVALAATAETLWMPQDIAVAHTTGTSAIKDGKLPTDDKDGAGYVPVHWIEGARFSTGHAAATAKKRQQSFFRHLSTAVLVSLACLAVAFATIHCARKLLLVGTSQYTTRSLANAEGDGDSFCGSDSGDSDEYSEETSEYGEAAEPGEDGASILEEGTADERASCMIQELLRLISLGSSTIPSVHPQDRVAFVQLLLTIAIQELAFLGTHTSNFLESQRLGAIEVIVHFGNSAIAELATHETGPVRIERTSKLVQVLEGLRVPCVSLLEMVEEHRVRRLADEVLLARMMVLTCTRAMLSVLPWVGMTTGAPRYLTNELLTILSYARHNRKRKLRRDKRTAYWIKILQRKLSFIGIFKPLGPLEENPKRRTMLREMISGFLRLRYYGRNLRLRLCRVSDELQSSMRGNFIHICSGGAAVVHERNQPGGQLGLSSSEATLLSAALQGGLDEEPDLLLFFDPEGAPRNDAASSHPSENEEPSTSSAATGRAPPTFEGQTTAFFPRPTFTTLDGAHVRSYALLAYRIASFIPIWIGTTASALACPISPRQLQFSEEPEQAESSDDLEGAVGGEATPDSAQDHPSQREHLLGAPIQYRSDTQWSEEPPVESEEQWQAPESAPYLPIGMAVPSAEHSLSAQVIYMPWIPPVSSNPPTHFLGMHAWHALTDPQFAPQSEEPSAVEEEASSPLHSPASSPPQHSQAFEEGLQSAEAEDSVDDEPPVHAESFQDFQLAEGYPGMPVQGYILFPRPSAGEHGYHFPMPIFPIPGSVGPVPVPQVFFTPAEQHPQMSEHTRTSFEDTSQGTGGWYSYQYQKTELLDEGASNVVYLDESSQETHELLDQPPTPPEPPLQPQPLLQPQVLTAPEPPLQPQPLLQSQVLTALEPPLQPQPLLQSQVLTAPEPPLQPQPLLQSQVLTPPEPSLHPQPLLQSQVLTAPEPPLQPQPLLQSHVLTAPEPPLQPQPLLQPQVLTSPEPSLHPQPLLQSQVLSGQLYDSSIEPGASSNGAPVTPMPDVERNTEGQSYPRPLPRSISNPFMWSPGGESALNVGLSLYPVPPPRAEGITGTFRGFEEGMPPPGPPEAPEDDGTAFVGFDVGMPHPKRARRQRW